MINNKLVFVFLIFGFLGVLSEVTSGETLPEWVDALQKGDYKKAFEIMKPLAEQGDVELQHNVGFFYQSGQGTTKDNKKAVKMYRLAAEQGFAESQYNLGIMYQTGQGVTQDYKEALKWYRLAAEQGQTNAQKILPEIEKKVEKARAFEGKLLAMEKSRFLTCDAFMGNLRAETLSFDGTYNETILIKELKIYASVGKSRQITEQETTLAGGKLFKELKKTNGSDKLEKLMYLDQKTVECGGESKQIAAKKRSPREVSSDLQKASRKCFQSAPSHLQRMLSNMFTLGSTYQGQGDYRTSMDTFRNLLRTGRQQGVSNCNE
jgi:TPR repeat protein